jgi:hypothetical protein
MSKQFRKEEIVIINKFMKGYPALILIRKVHNRI